jgi:2-C-methyl-D-erythritol 2,4-cyclodiphosphate synthase
VEQQPTNKHNSFTDKSASVWGAFLITGIFCRYLQTIGAAPAFAPYFINTNMSYRIGTGTDFHQLVAGRELWIGGVNIPHHKGALGHSDADVLLHAICDAMLGACCLGDIGVHFPDTDPALKNIDSKILLAKTTALITKAGYRVVNIDSTLCLQAPKIKPFIPQMQEVIAGIVGIGITDVSVKATTTEQMGFVGREEGLVAYASALLIKIET